MSNFKFEKGKKYITPICPGWIYECLGFREDGTIILHATHKTQEDTVQFQNPKHLIFMNYKEYVEPRRGSFWINVYDDGQFWSKKEYADLAARRPRIACVEIHWTEGEGL